MSNRRRALIAVTSLLILPPDAVPAPSGAVPFLPSRGGAVIVPALVDGRGPYSFLVDTGATRSVLRAGVARELALPAAGRMAVVTPAGNESREAVRIGRLSVGDAAAEGILASVVDADALRMAGERFDGLLGQDFLSRFDFTIDYRRRQLAWGAGEASATARRFPLQREGGRLLVDLPQPEGDRPLRLVPDSGATGLVVFDRGTRVPLRAELIPGRAEVTGSSGKRGMVTMRRIRRLQVGDLTLRDQVAAVVDRKQEGAPEGDGLLPLHRFASVSFDAAGSYMVIRPR